MRQYIGAIEAGGTKFNCMVGRGPESIAGEVRVSTTSPQDTLAYVEEFFQPYAERGELAAIGVASFGPLDLDPQSPTFGSITTTPKEGWSGVNLAAWVRQTFDLPVIIDTDVNAAAYGEMYWVPENQALDPLVYVTVGTGIGVGVLVNGKPLHGLLHAEAGHLSIPHDWTRDPFPGTCPYHGDCLEGLASGPAIAKRWDTPTEELPIGHPAWQLEAYYLGVGLANLLYTLSPRRIILGGGVASHPGLLESVRLEMIAALNGYIHKEAVLNNNQSYVIAPKLGRRSGVLGAMAMAMQ